MESEFDEYDSKPNGWVYLFQELRVKSKMDMGTVTVARLPINQAKNRYRDVLPIDETRVMLQNSENDYINANNVKVEDVGRHYLLTQGPLRQTCADFWQMVWEQNTHGIVMLNKIIEKGMLKCEPYWPATESRSPMTFDEFKITLIATEERFAYKIHELQLKNLETEEFRTVIHFQYTNWPDFGVPETADLFLGFLQEVRNYGVLGDDVGPCVVHCSAGIGRTGTFCLVDVILTRVEGTKDPDEARIIETLMAMRKQRYGLIQTPEQLRFSYLAILEGTSALLGRANGDEEGSHSEEGETEEGSKVEFEEDNRPLHQKTSALKDKSFDKIIPTKKVKFSYSQNSDSDELESEDSSNEEVVAEEPSSQPPPLPPRPPSLEKLSQLAQESDIKVDKAEDHFLGESSSERGSTEKDTQMRRRTDRNAALSHKVQDMKRRIQEHESRQKDWSPFVIMALFAGVLVFCGVRWWLG